MIVTLLISESEKWTSSRMERDRELCTNNCHSVAWIFTFMQKAFLSRVETKNIIPKDV